MSQQTRNWITAIFAVSLLVALAAILGALSVPRSPDPRLKRPSTFFTDESGARALLLVMKQLLPAAEQWRRPLNLLPLHAGDDSPTTLIVAGPRRPISVSEADHLDRWLAEGGQLILATSDGWQVTRRLALQDQQDQDEEKPSEEHAKAANEAGRAATKESTFLSRHAPDIVWSKPAAATNERITGSLVPAGELNVQSRQKFSVTENSKVVASASEKALAIELPVGQGRIVALADPTIVSNRALREAENAIWLVTLAAGWRNGRVLVDEFHHGFGTQRGATELTWLFLKTPWGWCVLQIVAAGLIYAFGYRRRFGRIVEPPLPARASALELIEARAGFFQTAAAQGLAVELIVQNLCQELAKAYGRPVDVATLSHNLDALDKPDRSTKLLTSLRSLSVKSARGERLTDKEFVEVGRVAGGILQGHRS
ncbi:MAG: DUF4350 domain-containing protein [Candidatus Binatia bacterium]